MSDKKYRPEYRRFQTDSEYENSRANSRAAEPGCMQIFFLIGIIGLPIALYQDPKFFKDWSFGNWAFYLIILIYFGYQGYKKR